MLFAAATDHRYIQIGNVLDFSNKALEALDHAGWAHAEAALTSLVSGYTSADRMEESNAWRHPVDLVTILERAFETLLTAGLKVLVAAARYLAAHAPTVCAEGQTYQIAYRLFCGELLFEEP
jgi:hypothetical protein